MIFLASGVFKELEYGIRRTIWDFQKYIFDMLKNDSLKWPKAQALIQGISASIVNVIGYEALPINILTIAEKLRIAIELHPSSQYFRGKVEPVFGGFELNLYGQTSTIESIIKHGLPFQEHIGGCQLEVTNQGRFALSHEIGHIFFYSSIHPELTPERIYSRKIGGKFSREEGLCHDFARAILIPNQYRKMINKEPSLVVLMKLSKIFGVGLEPLVRRILYDWQMWGGVIFFNITKKNTELRVNCFRGSDRKKSVKGNPTKTEVANIIKKASSINDIAEILKNKIVLDEKALMQNSIQSLWFMI
jgi:Zn-dependent peptidase ImmA (M78 family)